MVLLSTPSPSPILRIDLRIHMTFTLLHTPGVTGYEARSKFTKGTCSWCRDHNARRYVNESRVKTSPEIGDGKSVESVYLDEPDKNAIY